MWHWVEGALSWKVFACGYGDGITAWASFE